MRSKYAIVFLSWGRKYIDEVDACIQRSTAIEEYDRILITDTDTDLNHLQSSFSEIVRAKFQTTGHIRKAEMINFLPGKYDAYLYLDSDTTVLKDISLGFEKAKIFAIALSPAPQYDLDKPRKINGKIAETEVPCKGQLQYNAGVFFFNKSPAAQSVFQQYLKLALKYKDKTTRDQRWLTLAMEQVGFNPYTLSISYNYRGPRNRLCGKVRIWHNRKKIPININKVKAKKLKPASQFKDKSPKNKLRKKNNTT